MRAFECEIPRNYTTKKTKSTSSIWEKEITNNNNDTNNINLGLKENSVENRYKKKIIHIN